MGNFIVLFYSDLTNNANKIVQIIGSRKKILADACRERVKFWWEFEQCANVQRNYFVSFLFYWSQEYCFRRCVLRCLQILVRLVKRWRFIIKRLFLCPRLYTSKEILIAVFQERLTAREAMAHPYFFPVVEAARQGSDALSVKSDHSELLTQVAATS